MDVYVGIDCGATNCRLGVVEPNGNLLDSVKFSSPLRTHPQHFGQIIKEHLDQLMKPEWSIKAIGVGTPGPLDLENGLILPSSNIGNAENINLKGQLESLFNVPIYFDRDTNVALLGESWVGIAKGVQDAVMLTLGSGVGGALMINGGLERGASGKAGELGHVLLSITGPATRKPQNLPTPLTSAGPHSGAPLLASPVPKSDLLIFRSSDSPTCGLGHQGCLEAWINSTKDLEEFSYFLGLGLANIVDIFNPQMIVIGGGKVNIGDFLTKAIEVMKENGTKGAVDEVKVLYAKLGDSSGVYGAAKLAIDNLTK